MAVLCQQCRIYAHVILVMFTELNSTLDGTDSGFCELKVAAAVTELFIILWLSTLPKKKKEKKDALHFSAQSFNDTHGISSFLLLFFSFPVADRAKQDPTNYVHPCPNQTSRIIWSSMSIKWWFICSFGCDGASLVNWVCAGCCVASGC